MANKYIIHGATYNGDGTSSVAATSNGGVGAWNNINIFEGTAPAYGSLAAGDVVYIRSKTAAGADITRTQTAGVILGSSVGTTTNWVTWILDAGTIWPGVDGTLTYSSAYYMLSVRTGNCVVADRKYALVQLCTSADTGNTRMFEMAANSSISGILLNWASVSSGHGPHLGLNDKATMRDFKVRSVFHYNGLIQWQQYEYVTLISPEIELLSASETDAVFSAGNYGSRIDVIGGRIYGVGAGENTCLYDCTWNVTPYMNIISMDYPRTMPAFRGLPSTVQGGGVTAVGLDGGAGALHLQRWGSANSRNDGNYPTLNAFLPNSQSTPWSWWLYPSGAIDGAPAQLSTMRMYIEEPAQKTVTLELLTSNDFGTLTKRQVWIDISYIDATTGERRSVSSWAPSGALDTSTATWSNSSYGPVSLAKKKITVQTPTTVKKDALITVTFFCAAKATSATQILFICPDVVVA